MSKIALITDTHFGWKRDSPLFQEYFTRFYTNIFFPELKRRKIKKIIHGGDLFERREWINFQTLNSTRRDFLEQVEEGKYEFHIIVGNHDCYYRDRNAVNSLAELLRPYKNFHSYEEPQEITIDGLKIMLVPWLNTSNMQAGLDAIAASEADVLIGHLEISGFKFDQTQIAEHGLDRSIFRKYKRVFSGHYHTASEEGPIKYLGAPYEYTFIDHQDPKGFYIFDTETLELEFIQNPECMFYKLTYDDRVPLLDYDFSEFKNKYVRITIVHKSNPLQYEQWYDKIINENPTELSVNDLFVLEVSDEAEAQFIDFTQSVDGQVTASDTLSILDNYVDSIEMDLDKTRMKHEMHEIFTIATSV